MSGSGAAKRKQAEAKRAHSMSALGYTHRDIAVALGMQAHQISKMVALGERLKSIEPSAAAETLPSSKEKP